MTDGTIFNAPFDFGKLRPLPLKVEFLEIAVQVTGLTKEDITAQIKAGSTLTAIIEKSGKLEDYKTAVLASIKTSIDKEVIAGIITQAQADAKYTEVQKSVADGTIFNNPMCGEKGPHGELKGPGRLGLKGNPKANGSAGSIQAPDANATVTNA